MTEKEKVMSWLEGLTYDNWRDFYSDSEIINTAQAALALLEKYKEGKWIVLDNCSNAGIYCSECHNKIFDYPSKPKKKLSNFCPNCGSRNEQFYNPSTGKYMNGL